MNPTDESGRSGREPLADTLRRAADELALQHPPPQVWHALRSRMEVRPVPALVTAGTTLPAATPKRWLAPWAAAAACALLVIGGSALLLNAPAPAVAPAALARLEAQRLLDGFVPVAGPDAWTGPVSAAWLVRAELPRERLVEFGLPFDPARAGEPVHAQLLLRDSGEVLAVRVLAAANRP